MTQRIWNNNGGDNFWGTAGNWSGGAVPIAGDDVVFNGTTIAECKINQAVDVRSLTQAADWTGILRNLNYNVAVGDLTLRSTVYRGTGTWTISGDFNYAAATISDWWLGSTLLSGSDNTISGHWQKYLCNTTFETGSKYQVIEGWIDFYGGVTELKGELWANTAQTLRWRNDAKLRIRSTGKINGAGYFTVPIVLGAGIDVYENGGSYKALETHIEAPTADTVLVSGIILGKLIVSLYTAMDAEFRPPAALRIMGDVEIRCWNADGTLTVNNSVNNSVWYLEGNFSQNLLNGGQFTWTRGNGRIEFNDTDDATRPDDFEVDFTGMTLEDITLNRDLETTGELVFLSDVAARSLTASIGTFDLRGHDLNLDSNLIIQGKGVANKDGNVNPSGLVGSHVTVGGYFDASGDSTKDINLDTLGHWWLDVASTSGTRTYIRVRWCDAREGVEIAGTHIHDEGYTLNWAQARRLYGVRTDSGGQKTRHFQIDGGGSDEVNRFSGEGNRFGGTVIQGPTSRTMTIFTG